MTGSQPLALVAAVSTGAAVWWAHPSPWGLRRLSRERPARVAVVAPGAAAVLLLAMSWWMLAAQRTTLPVVAAGCLGVTVACRRLWLGRRRRRQRRARSAAVIAFCDALSAELRAGLSAVVAVERSVSVWPPWGVILTAARLGGDVPAALRRVATAPGADGMRAVAAAWEVADHSGAALADVLDQIAAGLRSDDDARAEVTAALATPRATGKMLALLPVFGLGLGVAMGADPLGFLLHTSVGLGCLGAGVSLALIGVWWIERMADAVEA